MNFEKFNNLLETKKNKLPDYLLDNYFSNFLITFRNYYYAK